MLNEWRANRLATSGLHPAVLRVRNLLGDFGMVFPKQPVRGRVDEVDFSQDTVRFSQRGELIFTHTHDVRGLGTILSASISPEDDGSVGVYISRDAAIRGIVGGKRVGDLEVRVGLHFAQPADASGLVIFAANLGVHTYRPDKAHVSSVLVAVNSKGTELATRIGDARQEKRAKWPLKFPAVRREDSQVAADLRVLGLTSAFLTFGPRLATTVARQAFNHETRVDQFLSRGQSLPQVLHYLRLGQE